MRSVTYIGLIAITLVICDSCNQEKPAGSRPPRERTPHIGNGGKEPHDFKNLDSQRIAFTNAHGIDLPERTSECHNWIFKKYFALSAIIIEEKDLDWFLRQLEVVKNERPTSNAPADPNILGWGVWRVGAATFIAAEDELDNVKIHDGLATPINMYSCKSTLGNFLHVDVWKEDAEHCFLRVYTRYGYD